MSLYNIIPFLNGYKRLISGYGLLALGLGGLFTAIGQCLVTLDVQQCFSGISSAWEPLVAAFLGLGIIGQAHAQEKEKA